MKTLTLYDNSVIKPVGTTTLKCEVNGRRKRIRFEIIKEAEISLLSGSAAEALRLIKFDDCIFKVTTNSLTKDRVMQEYQDVFTGLGRLPGVYSIEMDQNVKPVQDNPRRVPIPLKAELKKKIQEMEAQQIIQKVVEPTRWISSLVVVKKPNKIRLCLDPSNLNKGINRNNYPTPTIEDISPNLSKAQVFSVVDAKDGFLQVVLDEQSSYLTTFWTPFGRYRWLRMPFGLKSAPEEFQRRLDECLEGLQNIAVIADDIIIYGTGDTTESAEASHDKAFEHLLIRCREKKLKLNEKKIKFKLDKVAYMGHVISKEGLEPDPEKVRAFVDMPCPTDTAGVQRLIGVATYLAKFMPKLSTVCEPLRRLTDAKAVFDWLPQHENAFQTIKSLLIKAPVLKHYDVDKPVTLESDSSDVGLGAVISQDGHPIAYASRALTQTEQNYAQIEKECLSIVFAAERFEHYILGKDKVKALTDHKPLVTIFKKPILTSPKRLQRMRLRLQKYSLDIEYKPGPQMHISDTLSRASLPHDDDRKSKPDYVIYQVKEEQKRSREFEDIDEAVFVTDERLHKIRLNTAQDSSLQTLMNMIKAGWPEDKYDVPLCIRDYWPYRDEISTHSGLVYRGTRLIIPIEMRSSLIQRAHASHLGIQYTINTAKEIMFWPRMSAELKEAVQKCSVCEEFQPANQKDELMTHPIPEYPWQAVASDCFELDGKHYVVVVDMYSDYIEFAELRDMTSETLIKAIRPILANHGSPSTMWTDNGPNFASREFSKFAAEWEFQHCTSSPHYHKSNGKAESAVKIMKNMMKKAKRDNKDVYKCLLEWRNSVTPGTPSSPVQRLMSRRTRSFLPCKSSLYQPEVIPDVADNVMSRRRESKRVHDKHAKVLPELMIGQPVRVKTAPHVPHSKWQAGQVVSNEGPRSYGVKVESRVFRRNRSHIKDSATLSNISNMSPQVDITDEPEPKNSQQIESHPMPCVAPPSSDMVTTRSGRISKPPDFLKYEN